MPAASNAKDSHARGVVKERMEQAIALELPPMQVIVSELRQRPSVASICSRVLRASHRLGSWHHHRYGCDSRRCRCSRTVLASVMLVTQSRSASFMAFFRRSRCRWRLDLPTDQHLQAANTFGA